ncbi:hypothetical protein 019DV002_12 [Bacillus phage 019DV002]|uniref:Uncharacterized protein n=1 Tax=Bacillus phage 019DV002 TaxID=2601653 RepID=A0A5J6T5Y1_9CAUD|nr:hypothetical protein 019DV002_12 [Bacillus phage 019DV002]QFG05241.1 hypothetical protein 019DV004_12 [Bacillus phage 019DV004]
MEERIKSLELENEKLKHEANRAKLLEDELNKYKEKYEVVEILAEAYKAHRDSLPQAEHLYPPNYWGGNA